MAQSNRQTLQFYAREKRNETIYLSNYNTRNQGTISYGMRLILLALSNRGNKFKN